MASNSAADKPTPIAIGERRKPQPHGSPGYLRIDTVHQGDQDGLKGVYHVNAVDIITQWEVVAAVERISEAFLLPVILIATQKAALTRGDWIAFLASAVLLMPKNYVWGDDDFWHAWSYQIVLNPLIVVAAMVVVLGLAFAARRQAIAA